MSSNIELGDLAHIRRVLEWVEDQEENGRPLRPADDLGIIALREVAKRLRSALADAKNADMELTVEQYASAQGLNLWTVYKQVQRGKIPGAKKRAGVGIRIPLKSAA